jgi:shikimate dehydrogenase
MILLGIISDERAYRSKSPAMHNHVMARIGLDGLYMAWSVRPDRVADAVAGLRALGIRGANVTVPYKEAVMPYLDHLSDQAKAIGAVNTIVHEGDRLEGHNTDALGFRAALADLNVDIRGAGVMVLGAGGAAKAVLSALKDSGAAGITLLGRNPDRTRATAALFGARPASLEDIRTLNQPVDLFVNASAVSSPGEAPELANILADVRMKGLRLVYDLNYGRPQNLFRDWAETVGARFSDGLAMLAHQARESFFLWTGQKPDVSEFLAGLK